MSLSRQALRALGLGFLVLAGALGVLALEHMRALAAYGVICGASHPHCPACPAAISAALLGLAALALAARPAPAEARARSTEAR